MKTEPNLFREKLAESSLFFRRTVVSFIIVLCLIGILITHFYSLQITCFEDYHIRSNENRIKVVPILPRRGTIYDCRGIPLAFNRTVYQLELVPEQIDNLKDTIETLRPIVNLTDDDITNFEKERRYRHLISLPIKSELTEVQRSFFYVNKHRFPGVTIKAYQRRYYPYGDALTHVIGYVSKINNQDMETLYKNGTLSSYIPTNDIGKLGIERYYEKILRGNMGYEEVEVNNRGRVIRRLHEKPPKAGKDIILTLDVHLQMYITTLITGSRAAVIVVDPRDGSILSLVSHPSYDPNVFVQGISTKKYTALLQDKNLPMMNRATQGNYPPASTVKPYISISALTIGMINKNFGLFDPGWWQLPASEKRYRDWKHGGHGWLNITKALEESSDTFFYHLAYDMGICSLSEWMTKFGYGKYTGIDLLEECTAIMPSREWKMKRFKRMWYPGDTIPVGIGQGYWTATPIQMLKALMTLINNGTVLTPHLLKFIQHKKNNVNRIYTGQIGDPHSISWEIVKNGMYGVAHRYNGTARKSFADAAYKIAAKSGTAQLYNLKLHETYESDKIPEKLRDHKLMTAFAPFDNPTVGIVVVLENGGVGPEVGTITRKILDYILLKRSS